MTRSAVRRSWGNLVRWGAAGISTALLSAPLLSCVRYARVHVRSTRSGTCEGACRHYADCKDDERPESLQSCVADCRDIYVHEGDVDSESLMEFEDLDCKDAVAFVEGDDRGRNPTAGSRPVKGRARAQ
ncbi:MAG TPA: hypothetical protein VEL05_10295 [Candidatus Acidoferrum sp.]|nr:hypothetical protein [Candidatus Acidoferrum sp.]